MCNMMVKCIVDNNLPALLCWYQVSLLGPTSFSDILQIFPSRNPPRHPKMVNMIGYPLTALLTSIPFQVSQWFLPFLPQPSLSWKRTFHWKELICKKSMFKEVCLPTTGLHEAFIYHPELQVISLQNKFNVRVFLTFNQIW